MGAKTTCLDHAGMIPDIVSGPWSSILHRPTIFRDLLCRGNQSIDPNFKLLIVSLHQNNKMTSNEDVSSRMNSRNMMSNQFPIRMTLGKNPCMLLHIRFDNHWTNDTKKRRKSIQTFMARRSLTNVGSTLSFR